MTTDPRLLTEAAVYHWRGGAWWRHVAAELLVEAGADRARALEEAKARGHRYAGQR